jgi:hypothetical protein
LAAAAAVPEEEEPVAVAVAVAAVAGLQALADAALAQVLRSAAAVAVQLVVGQADA